MRFAVPDTTDNHELNKVLWTLRTVFENISLDNMNTVTITGTTDSTPDTDKEFRHGRGAVPSLVFYQEGDVYVPRNGLGADTLKVNSRLADQQFKIILVF